MRCGNLHSGVRIYPYLLVLAAFLSVLAVPATGYAEEDIKIFKKLPKARPDYPVPNDKNLLFYIQRSTNKNTIVYAARLDEGGKFDTDDPIEVFWRQYNTDGKKKELELVEKQLAFGFVAEPSPKEDNTYHAHIVSYPARKALVRVDRNGAPQVIIRIGKRLVQLVYAYIDVDEDGYVPIVHFVDLIGLDPGTGKYMRERIHFLQ